MILGIFFIRPILLPAQENSDLDTSQGHLEGNASSSASDRHDSSHAPLLEYDFAEGVYSEQHRVTANNGESYAMEDVPSHHQDDEDGMAHLSDQRRSLNRDDATMMFDQKPNLYGKRLWLSGDFWLLFTILGIRKSCLTS